MCIWKNNFIIFLKLFGIFNVVRLYLIYSQNYEYWNHNFYKYLESKGNSLRITESSLYIIITIRTSWERVTAHAHAMRTIRITIQ